jgi:hypothetical protein
MRTSARGARSDAAGEFSVVNCKVQKLGPDLDAAAAPICILLPVGVRERYARTFELQVNRRSELSQRAGNRRQKIGVARLANERYSVDLPPADVDRDLGLGSVSKAVYDHITVTERMRDAT